MAEKKLNTTKLDKIIKDQKKDNGVITYEINGETIEIQVRRTVSIQEFAQIVTDVSESVCSGNVNDHVPYSAFYKETAIGLAILSNYTNIKDDIGVDRMNAILFETDILDKVEDSVNQIQLNALMIAIDDQIEFYKQEAISTEHKHLIETTAQFNKATVTFEQFTRMFEGIDINQLLDMGGKLASMDEKKFAESIMEVRGDMYTDGRIAEIKEKLAKDNES